ncbi:hypothetical protein TSAR_009203 [Trichomalopsis sarcophagae]|uniref:Uncharacterized protein n=1 Tax=Trichomalopsis sarcophagae TaxID=543379 RepID=A0A232EQW0_9HYME|nr:hypothetical protein TSAR_009203 [Trichomalopsis sarcophagae]
MIYSHGLPDSPPDSCSEPPCSPPKTHEAFYVHSPLTDGNINQSTEILLKKHRSVNESYSPTSIPHSSCSISNTQDSMLLSHPVLTPLLTGRTTSISKQQQLQSSTSQTRTQSHHQQFIQQQFDSQTSIMTLYTSLQSVPKKRKHSQDGLLRVKQMFLDTLGLENMVSVAIKCMSETLKCLVSNLAENNPTDDYGPAAFAIEQPRSSGGVRVLMMLASSSGRLKFVAGCHRYAKLEVGQTSDTADL